MSNHRARIHRPYVRHAPDHCDCLECGCCCDECEVCVAETDWRELGYVEDGQGIRELFNE